MTTVLLQNKCIYIAFVYLLCYLAKHNMSKKGLVVFISLCLIIKNVFMLISSLFSISFSVIFIFCCFNMLFLFVRLWDLRNSEHYYRTIQQY